jgi:hypothetical protein
MKETFPEERLRKASDVRSLHNPTEEPASTMTDSGLTDLKKRRCVPRDPYSYPFNDWAVISVMEDAQAFRSLQSSAIEDNWPGSLADIHRNGCSLTCNRVIRIVTKFSAGCGCVAEAPDTEVR